MNKDKINIGVSGEYFVAAELARRGFSATLTMKNTKFYDVLVIDNNGKQYALQVKTLKGSNKKWPLNVKNENIKDNNVFYVFVCLNGLENPDYYIVPSKVVAKQIHRNHIEWLKAKGKNGQVHNDSKLRNFTINDEKYHNAWNLITTND